MNIELRGISKRFGPVRANQDIDLQIRAGEVLGLLGENGAGKSTLMNILSGLYRQDSGEILIDGAPAAFAVRLAEPLPPRSGWLEPATWMGLPLSLVHTMSVLAHMPLALSAASTRGSKPSVSILVAAIRADGAIRVNMWRPIAIGRTGTVSL